MKFRLEKGVGYMYSYAPNHYLANSAGKVYEHTYVMCEAIGRPLNGDECVHHIDRNRTNNNFNNLQLMTRSEHARLHQIEDHGVVYVDSQCPVCTTKFETTLGNRRKYCSQICAKKASRKFEVSREDLELLVWSKPTTEVAKMLGVSDVAVAKRCRKLGIQKPPRGY